MGGTPSCVRSLDYPTMRNWLGQDIQVGSVVYRGARSGNTSEYKVGLVTKLNEEKKKVTVDWIIEKRYSIGKPFSKSGTSDVNTMVLINFTKEELFDKAEELWREENKRRHELNRGLTPMDRWW